MSTNPPYPPNSNQPPYPSQQPMSQYPPPAMMNYGSAYPPPSNQAPYPPPVETVASNPAFPPPPTYESAVGTGGKPAAPNAYGNYAYQTQPIPPAQPPPPTYSSPDVEYGASEFSAIVSFSDKSIRLGMPRSCFAHTFLRQVFLVLCFVGVLKLPNKFIGFIRRVFAVLMLQLLTTVGFICLFLFSDKVKGFARNNMGLYISAYVVFFVLYFVLVCCEGVRRNYPSNVILLALFTLSLSYLVGVISSFHETNIVLIMMGVTTLVCASVMIFACQTKYDFTTWGGVLFCAALAIFFLSIFTPLWLALSTTAGKIVIGGLLALVFVAFLAYDVQLVMGGKKYELSPEEYIFASLILYMDIIRIFLLLLAIFGRGSN